MRTSALVSLSLLVATTVACSMTSTDASPEALAESTGRNVEGFTTDGSEIKFTPVVMTSDMAARANGAPQASPPSADLGLPAAASVRAAMSAVKDQGHRGTCATFSSAGLAERYVRGDISEQCVVREIGGNDGAFPDTRLDLYTSRGAVDEAACPYDALSSTVNIPSPYNYDTLAAGPGTLALVEYAKQSKSAAAADAFNYVKQSVASGNPVTVNFVVVDDAGLSRDPAQVIDVPAVLKCKTVAITAGASCDGHSVVIVGYNDADSTFTLKNSWGTAWKDGGFGRMSYAYFKRFAYQNINGLRPKFAPLPPVRGDFDGDGRQDVIIVTAGGSYEYLGKADGTFTENAWSRTDLTLGSVDYVPSDFNGDGKADVMVVTKTGSFLYLGKAGGGFVENAWVRSDLTLGHVRYTPGDFNGDWRKDLVITTHGGSYVYLGKSDGTFIPDVYTRSDLSLGNVSFTPGDFNGDGRTDLVIVTAGGSYVYSGKTDGTFVPDVFVRNDLVLGAVQYTPGDFNGDRRADLLITTAGGTYEYLGRSDGAFTENAWTRTDLTLGAVEIVAADICGDGKTDIVITNRTGSYVYRGAFVGFVSDVYVRNDLTLGNVRFFPSDFNGDGRADLIVSTASGSYAYDGKADGTFVQDVWARTDLSLSAASYF